MHEKSYFIGSAKTFASLFLTNINLWS